MRASVMDKMSEMESVAGFLVNMTVDVVDRKKKPIRLDPF